MTKSHIVLFAIWVGAIAVLALGVAYLAVDRWRDTEAIRGAREVCNIRWDDAHLPERALCFQAEYRNRL